MPTRMFRLELQAQPYLSVSRTSIDWQAAVQSYRGRGYLRVLRLTGALPRETGARPSILRRPY
jgi:hypothetical protein